MVSITQLRLGLEVVLRLDRLQILSSLDVDLYLLPVKEVVEVFNLIGLWIGHVQELAFIRPVQKLVHLGWVIAANRAEGGCRALLGSHL